MTRISVIVPVYNAEDTLERCIGSVLAQTHSDLDVILVDDGSTDISGAMCDAYVEFDKRVRALHTSNKGLSAARNLGIDCALSVGAELIAFVDADDFLEPFMFGELLTALESTGADIVQCGTCVHGLHAVGGFVPPTAEYNKREAINALIGGAINNGVWNKLYRNRIFDGIRFPEGRVTEEVATTYRMLLSCDKFISIPIIGYHYVKREGSITRTHTMRNLADYWVAYKERYDYFTVEAPELLDEEAYNKLTRRTARAVSRMWRWAYANNLQERAAYADLLSEMRDFVRGELKSVDKSSWPIHLRFVLFLAQSDSTASLATCYVANQFFIRAFPNKSGSRK